MTITATPIADELLTETQAVARIPGRDSEVRSANAKPGAGWEPPRNPRQLAGLGQVRSFFDNNSTRVLTF